MAGLRRFLSGTAAHSDKQVERAPVAAQWRQHARDYRSPRPHRRAPIKDAAAAVLAAMGLDVSDAFRLMMVRIARENALPFAPLVPNAGTIEAMQAARRGELVTVGKPEHLRASLNANG